MEELKHKQQLKIGSGLNNLGNTCFFNAVMQSVLHTKKLALYLESKNHSKHCQRSQWCIFCQTQRTYQATRNARVFAPNGLVNNLKKVFKKFKLGRQQDSHEFLRYLIEGMQECETGKLGKDRQKNESLIKKTKIFNIFGGIIKNVVLCLNCKHKSVTKERYYDFNIECQKSNSLDQGLQKFFAVDELKGPNKYLCESCKNRVDATKRFYLQTAGNTLTFQLKRFTNMLRKIGKFIKYPKFIHLGKYFDHERKTVARLSAVIVHAGGTADSGHYYAFVRVGQLWYRMDDSYVTKCNEEQAMSQNAYVLFYEKVKDQAIEKQQKQQMKQEAMEKQQAKVNVQNKEKPLKRLFEIAELQEKLEKDQKREQENQKKIQTPPAKVEEKSKSNENTKQNKGSQERTTDAENCNTEPNSFKRDAPQDVDSDDDLPLPPGTLQRKRSKLEAEQNMTLQQVLFKYAINLKMLQSKLPSSPNINRPLRSVYRLRKYEIQMKRRKIAQ